MKILFLQRDWIERLGIMSVSAVLKQGGHACDLLVEKNSNRILDYIGRTSPDILAFPCITGEHQWAKAVAARAKKEHPVVTLLGGPHPTIYPEIIEDENVDFICRGEGEFPTLELLNALENGGDPTAIRNVWAKHRGKVYRNDLRELIREWPEFPAADRSIYYDKYKYFRKFPTKTFITGRGCPFECTFCHNNILKKIVEGKGPYVRKRPVKNVISEIQEVRKKYPLKTIRFSDDMFAANRKWLFEFLDVYKTEIAIPYIFQLTANTLTEDMVRKLAESGAHCVEIGLESGSEEFRCRVLKKRLTDQVVERAVTLLRKYGLKFVTFNMIGFPGERLEDALRTVRFNIDLGTDYPMCSIFMPYPKTELGDEAIRLGVIQDNDMDRAPGLFLKSSILKQKDIHRLINLQKLFYAMVKIPYFYPIGTRLVKLPLTGFFSLIFLLSYAHHFKKRTRLSLLQTANFFWKWRGVLDG